MTTERTIEILLKFVNSEITHNSNDAYCNITDIDYAVEQESTADGFSVYTFKHPNDEVCISENLYYYDKGNCLYFYRYICHIYYYWRYYCRRYCYYHRYHCFPTYICRMNYSIYCCC